MGDPVGVPVTPPGIWAGDFGDAYTARNVVDPASRAPFWECMAVMTGPASVLEIGCNRGHNLSALRRILPDARLVGVDVNREALRQVPVADRIEVAVCRAADVATVGSEFGLVFTAGVLIHVPPAELDAVLNSMAAVSRRWLLAVEYEAETETMINYRGQDDLLWKRPYGALLARYGEVVARGLATKADGFDNCTWTLVAKEGA